MPIASHPSTGNQHPPSGDHIESRPLLCQGYLLELLQGTMSCSMTPAPGTQQTLLAASVSTTPTALLHFQLLLIRNKKASTQLPPHICFSLPWFPSLFFFLDHSRSVPVPALLHLPPRTLPLAALHSLISFISCTLTSAPPSLTKCLRQPEVKLSLLPGNPGPHKSLGNPKGLY